MPVNYQNVKIVRHPKSLVVSVYDGPTLVHRGHRPVDKNFSERVYSTITEAGYEAVEKGTETTFRENSKAD